MMAFKFQSARWPQVARCSSAVSNVTSLVPYDKEIRKSLTVVAPTKPWSNTSWKDVRRPTVNQSYYFCHDKYTPFFRCQGNLRHKWDDAHFASTLVSNEIAATPLYHEVKQMIESWAKKIDGNQPTKEHEKELENLILKLDQRVEFERTLHSEHDENVDENSTKSTTDDSLPGDVTPKTSQAKTFLELIQYILGSFDDEKLRELAFKVHVYKSVSIYFKSRVEFEAALKDVQCDRIEEVRLGESNVYTTETIDRAYNDIQAMLCTPSDLVNRINRLQDPIRSDEKVLEWDESFVEPTNKDDLDSIVFHSDSSKASALIVSGESGSGKTWFAQKYIPNKLGKQDLALIYHTISDDDGHKLIKSDESLKNQKMACGHGMYHLIEVGRTNSDIYPCLSNLSMEYNTNRDSLAYGWLKETIGKQFIGDKVVHDWWNSDEDTAKFQPIEKLVLVVDEVGRSPELARGLVSIVRKLYQHLRMNKAKQVMLVLAGSGLDRHIRFNSVPGIEFEDKESRSTIASFETDPMKSDIIILKGPNLTWDMVYGIPTKSILRGTY